MTRIDEIKARLKKVADIPDGEFLFDVCVNNAAGGGYYLGGCYVDTHEQADAAQQFSTATRSDITWLIEQLEEKDRLLVKVMKTADDGLDKITAWVEKLGMISPEKLRELWGLRISKRKGD